MDRDVSFWILVLMCYVIGGAITLLIAILTKWFQKQVRESSDTPCDIIFFLMVLWPLIWIIYPIVTVSDWINKFFYKKLSDE